MNRITINARALDIVVNAMAAHRAEFDRLAGMEAEGLKDLAYRNSSPQSMEDMKARIEAQRKAARQRMKGTIEQQQKEFFADIDRQATPDGGQINPGDYELLRGALVESSEELTVMHKRYAANPTMLRAIAHYAADHVWEGFCDMTNASVVRAFGKEFFEMAKQAAENPNGYNAMLISDKGAILRMLNAHGLFIEQ